MNFINALLGVLALLSVALLFWQWLAARRFPLHDRVADKSFAPALTILKPLKGCDDTTAESLQSWFNQTYAGPIQILFGVAHAHDPVCEIVRELIKKNSGADAQLIVCGELLGANAKVAKLAELEPLAKYDLILICDADVRVPADFLSSFVAPLRDSTTGLVNCFYRLANPTTTAMQWETVAINADFWSQVLQSASFKPLDFALGAAILLRRKSLIEIGGFTTLAHCLADDYQLGNRIAQKGHRIALCPVVVECWDAPMDWHKVWKHQLRWARTVRVCQPLPYFLSILSNATLWPLIWFFVAFFSTKTIATPLLASACLLIRILLAQDLQLRFVRSRENVAPFWLVPVKDLLQVGLWATAFSGNQIEWRGRRMNLRRDGNLIPVEDGGR